MNNTPNRTSAAPRMNRYAGISWKKMMPKIVAPTGSSRAMVAVSKDFKFDKEEKYRVCAIAVDNIPKPKSERMIAAVYGTAKVWLAAKPKAPTIMAVNK
jgi:hypothetical protein